jgi:hypothetical protein
MFLHSDVLRVQLNVIKSPDLPAISEIRFTDCNVNIKIINICWRVTWEV